MSTMSILAVLSNNAAQVIADSLNVLMDPLTNVVKTALVAASSNEKAYNRDKTVFSAVIVIKNGDDLYSQLKKFNLDQVKEVVMPKVFSELELNNHVTMMSMRHDGSFKLGDNEDGATTQAYTIRLKFEIGGKTVDEQTATETTVNIGEEPNFDGMPLVNILGE